MLKEVPLAAIEAPADPPLNAEGEMDPETLTGAVRARQEWRLRSELAEKARNLKAEVKALMSQEYSYGSMVCRSYILDVKVLIRKIEAVLEKRYKYFPTSLLEIPVVGLVSSIANTLNGGNNGPFTHFSGIRTENAQQNRLTSYSGQARGQNRRNPAALPISQALEPLGRFREEVEILLATNSLRSPKRSFRKSGRQIL